MGDSAEEKLAPHATYEFKLSFRWVSWAVVASFSAIVVVGSCITFFASGYTREKDVIFRFYDTFNPCILFDHYPANVFTMIFFAMLATSHALYFLGMFSWVYLTKDFILTMVSSLGLVLSYITVSLLVMNIFPASLYPKGSSDVDLVNGEPGPLSGSTRHKVELHTLFYIQWLVGHIIAMTVLCKIIRYIQAPKTPWKVIIAFGVGMVAMALGSLAMIVALMERTETTTWLDDINTWSKAVLKALRNGTKFNVWHWIPALFWPFAMPKTEGITFSFILPTKSLEDVRQSVNPASFLSGVSIVLALAISGSYLQSNPARSSDFQLALAGAFEQQPYNFIFTTVWMLCTHAMGLCIFLSYAAARLHLGADAVRTKVILGLGVVLYVSMHLCLFLVLIDFPRGVGPVAPFFILLPIWLIAAFEVHWRTLSFAGVWYLAFLLCLVDNTAVATVFNMVLIGQMCLLSVWMPVDSFETVMVSLRYTNEDTAERLKIAGSAPAIAMAELNA